MGRYWYQVEPFDDGSLQIATGQEARDLWVNENKEGKVFVEVRKSRQRGRKR